MSRPQANWFEGYRLLALLCLLVAGLSAWLGAIRGFETEGVRMVIRFTARSSLILFCLAFSADALFRMWPSAWSRWQRRNRRELGLAFAASHGIHALAIVMFARMDPSGFGAATSPASFVFGGLGYVFLAAMAATSFGPTMSALGSRAWRILHLTGGYYLLLQFTISFGMRVPAMPLYSLFLLLPLAVLALRMTAAAARKPRTLQAG
jgi:DMSO/TMAO reductase YedYZ heme-binding membrane subunit